MGLFGQSTPFDADVEKATSETNTTDNWSVIMDVCDKVTSNSRSSKDCLKAIMKRMSHSDPHVVMQAITLLDACVNNCGKPFHLEIASRDFENEFRRLLSKAQPKVSTKMRQVLKSWAEMDFKSDPELNLIPSLYMRLKIEGYEFNNLNDKPKTNAKLTAALKDPNVVSSQQEEEDLAKAIELSLKENKGSPKHSSSAGTVSSTTYPSLYPSFGASGSLGSVNSNGNVSNNSQTTEARKVRALYDFEAAEENELTFFSGEIIHVLDDSDPNWWKGFNQRGEGLFPSNFVTADLSVDPERLDINQKLNKKNSQFEEDVQSKTETNEELAAAVASQQPVQIDEPKVDRLLHLLHEANPEDPSQDSEEMLRLEQEVHQMGPLIDNELERVDRKHAQLTQLSSDLVDAINLYHSLMANDRAALASSAAGFMPGLPSALNSQNFPVSGLGANSMLYGTNSTYSMPFAPPNPQMPSNFGSLPYNPAMPPTTAPPGLNTMTAGSAPPQVSNYVPNTQIQVPMQYRNGNGFPQQVASRMGAPSSQPPQSLATVNNGLLINGVPQQNHQNNYMEVPPVDPQQKQSFVNNIPQQQIQQVSQQAQFMSPQHQQQSTQQAPQSNQTSYIPHQHPQALSQQFNSLPNGPQPYMVPPSSVAQGPGAQVSAVSIPQMNNYSHEQFSQLQQHLASMTIGVPQHPQQLQNPPSSVAPSISNIPIYQQQP